MSYCTDYGQEPKLQLRVGAEPAQEPGPIHSCVCTPGPQGAEQEPQVLPQTPSGSGHSTSQDIV